MDSNKYSVILVSLEASETEGAYLTNAGYPLSYEGNTYQNVEGLKVDLPAESGGLDKDEGKLEGVGINDSSFLTRLSNHYPFSKVEVTVRELDIDLSTDSVSDVRTLFTGLVYQATPMPLTGYMNIIFKGWKYYTDITAGLPCTEQCAWGVLGNRGCGASVVEEEHTVAAVSSYTLTILGSLSDTRSFLFNKGYIEKEGARIKIKYHETGNTFQLSKPAPATWVGSTITIYSGCDRQLSTCRDVYDNEERFMGLGVAMVDYNPFYENP